MIQSKLGITRGQTFVSLSLAGLMVVISLTAATWVWSMDGKRGTQLFMLDKRITAIEVHDKAEAQRLERMEQKIDEIYRHILQTKDD